MSHLKTNHQQPLSTTKPRAIPAIIGLTVLLALAAIVVTGMVGLGRSWGLLPYGGQIVERVALGSSSWDPTDYSMRLSVTAMTSRGRERYSECRFRARLVPPNADDTKPLSVYESVPPSDPAGLRGSPSGAGESRVALHRVAVDNAALLRLRNTDGPVELIVDEFRGSDLVGASILRETLPIDWSGWDTLSKLGQVGVSR